MLEKKQNENPLNSARLIQMLQTLTKEERKSFARFLASPYHNTTEAILKFYQILIEYYPTFQPKDLTKGEIYQQVFERTYDENQMNQLMTKTCRALENFFAVEKLKKDELLTTKLKRDAFQQRQLSKQYTKANKQLQNLLDEEEHPDSNTYLELFLMNENLLYSGNLEQKQKELYLSNCLKKVDQWFVWQKLRLSCIALNEIRVKSVDFDLFLLDDILNTPLIIKEGGAIFQFYKEMIQFQLERENVKISEVVSWFEEASELMPEKEKYNFILLLLNILLRGIREGKNSYRRLVFDIYKIGLRKKTLLIDNKLSHLTFINIAVSAIGCDEFEWAEKYIEENKDFVDTFKMDAVNLSYGYLLYYKGKKENDKGCFLKAIDHLLEVVSSKSYFQYRVKVLQLRIHYELSLQKGDDGDYVLYFAKAFRRHIRRKSELNQRKAVTFINFINLTEKLVKLRNERVISKQKARIEKLKEEINTTNPLFAGDWLNEKFSQLLSEIQK